MPLGLQTSAIAMLLLLLWGSAVWEEGRSLDVIVSIPGTWPVDKAKTAPKIKMKVRDTILDGGAMGVFRIFVMPPVSTRKIRHAAADATGARCCLLLLQCWCSTSSSFGLW